MSAKKRKKKKSNLQKQSVAKTNKVAKGKDTKNSKLHSFVSRVKKTRLSTKITFILGLITAWFLVVDFQHRHHKYLSFGLNKYVFFTESQELNIVLIAEKNEFEISHPYYLMQKGNYSAHNVRIDFFADYPMRFYDTDLRHDEKGAFNSVRPYAYVIYREIHPNGGGINDHVHLISEKMDRPYMNYELDMIISAENKRKPINIRQNVHCYFANTIDEFLHLIDQETDRESYFKDKDLILFNERVPWNGSLLLVPQALVPCKVKGKMELIPIEDAPRKALPKGVIPPKKPEKEIASIQK